MICHNCCDAGDANSAGMISIAEMLHAKCNYSGCYCQHRVKGE